MSQKKSTNNLSKQISAQYCKAHFMFFATFLYITVGNTSIA